MPSPGLIINNHKLETKFFKDHVQHTTFYSGASQEERRVGVVKTWHRDRELGRGGSGTVFLEKSGAGELRAVKEIMKDKHTRTKINYERELMAMAILGKSREHDSFFVKFFGWYESENYIHIAMEYISQGHLRHYLEVERSESETKAVVRQLLGGLVVIHHEGFAHRDLKPENIFVVSESPILVKIGDFGLAKLVRTGTAFRSRGGTMNYIAPEVEIDPNRDTSVYTNAIDIWSIGCITHELLTQVVPFRGNIELTRYCSCPKLPRESMLTKNVSQKGIEFVERTLAYPPEHRIGAKEALDSEWLLPECGVAAGLETDISSEVMAKPRIVVGVDFGVIFSAMAWTSTAAPDMVIGIAGWPSPGMRCTFNVPTEISYREGNTLDFTWGFDIDPLARRLKWFKLLLETNDPLARRLKWFKLLLETNDPHAPIGKILPPGMSAVDVTRDFLSGLYLHAIGTLWRQDPSLMQIAKVDFVLTVPADWSDEAKHRMREAAVQAGFTREHDLTLLSEPEAIVIYSMNRQTTPTLNVNDMIVLCNAGRWTVDLNSYAVLSIYPNLRVAECTVATGDFCGSINVDRNFEGLLEARLGARYSSMTAETQQRIIKNFEPVKCKFRDREGQSIYHVSLPVMNTVPEAGVLDGELHVTRDEMRALFDPLIDRILVLLSEQLQAITSGGHCASWVLLAGDFGELPYMYSRVKEWTDRWGMTLIQPRESDLAAAKGAALWGIESSLGPSRLGS